MNDPEGGDGLYVRFEVVMLYENFEIMFRHEKVKCDPVIGPDRKVL